MFRRVLICLMLCAFQVEAKYSFAPVVKKAMPSVVSIMTEAAKDTDDADVQNSLTFFDVNRGFIGSGFIADNEGYVLTNRHVIAKAKDIFVTTSDGQKHKGVLIGFDDVLDVALLKMESDDNMTAAVFADSDLLEVGDFIIAIGNPFGLKNSVTSGIVSAKGRDMNETLFDDYIQTDAPMNPGNSGGPMFNLKGEVVGLNTLIYSEQGNSLGVGFAIPSNQLKPIYEALKNTGKVVRHTIGVDLKETVYNGNKALMVITLIDENLCAQNDLRVGDIITSVNGVAVRSYKQFQEQTAWTTPDDVFVLEIWRDGEKSEKQVKTQAIQSNMKNVIIPSGYKIKSGIYYKKLGLTINQGKISDVDEKSEAFMKGIKAGDEIKAINGRAFFVADDLNFYIQESLDEHETLKIGLKDSDGNPYFVELTLQENTNEPN